MGLIRWLIERHRTRKLDRELIEQARNENCRAGEDDDAKLSPDFWVYPWEKGGGP